MDQITDRSKAESSGPTQIEAIASQQGPVQVIKFEGGEGLKHILIALIAALLITIPFSVWAIFASTSAQQASERAETESRLSQMWKQRLIVQLREQRIQVDD